MVVLLDPLRVAILQHVQGPGCLHRRMVWTKIPKSKLENSATPAVPAIRPGAIRTLIVKGTLDPAAPDKVRPASSEDIGAALIVGVADAKVPIRVPCHALTDRVDGTV